MYTYMYVCIYYYILKLFSHSLKVPCTVYHARRCRGCVGMSVDVCQVLVFSVRKQTICEDVDSSAELQSLKSPQGFILPPGLLAILVFNLTKQKKVSTNTLQISKQNFSSFLLITFRDILFHQLEKSPEEKIDFPLFLKLFKRIETTLITSFSNWILFLEEVKIFFKGNALPLQCNLSLKIGCN